MEIIIILLLIVIVIFLVYVLQKNKQNEKNIELLVKNNLEEFRRELTETVDNSRQELNQARKEINNQTVSTFKYLMDMQATIEKIITQQEQASKLGQSLKDLLSMPKLRGNYGEVVLEEMLERILPNGLWERQFKICDGCIVDAVIIYKDLYVPIDAKFPRDNYIKYIESENNEDKNYYWKCFERDFISKVKEISKYIRPEHKTSDFALMFIPSEAIYYEAIADKNYIGQDSKLPEILEKHKVIAVSPRNFYAFLQVVITSMKNLEVLNHAREVQMKLAKLQRNFDFFYKNYETIGKELEKASEAYRKGDKRINSYKKELDEILEIGSLEGEKLKEVN